MQRKKAFTLIELLVVIAVIALLMAILMPALQRVKRQAKAVICMTRLRQWGIWFPMYTQDNDDKFFGGIYSSLYVFWPEIMRPYYKDSDGILLCPMTVKHDLQTLDRGSNGRGSKFVSWADMYDDANYVYGSYSLNRQVRNQSNPPKWREPYWKTTLVKSPGNVPVFLDGTLSGSPMDESTGIGYRPPPYDDVGFACMANYCINRHDAHINGLFMDWSVRKVGLKELWTLKWHPDFDTANEWTIAGGVKPEDWPKWMRKFKDY